MATEKIDQEILRIDDSICRHINNITRDSRGYVAQDVITDLRHFVEHIMLKKYMLMIRICQIHMIICAKELIMLNLEPSINE